jgi:hypothetical protein
MDKIFVSYSSHDIAHVNSISSIGNENLSKNINFWIATQKKDKLSQLKPGEKWREEIKKSIQESKGAVLLVSENFLAAEIVTDFELPLILKKKAEDPSYKIYPLLLNECKYKDNPFLNEIQFTNSPSTNLSSLSGKRYQLEIENVIHHINNDFENKKNIRSKLLLLFGAVIFGLSLFIFGQRTTVEPASINPNITTQESEDSAKTLDILNLGVGDCFNISITDKNAWIDVDGGSRDPNGYDIVSNPFFQVSDKTNCSELHHAQILTKFQVTKDSYSNLLFPGSYLGVMTSIDICYTDLNSGTCIGVVIDDVVTNSPAEIIGLKKNDVITSVNGIPVGTYQELSLVLDSITSEKERKNVILGIVPENSTKQKRVVDLLPKFDIPDSRKEILLESQDFCNTEGSLYNPYDFEELSGFINEKLEEKLLNTFYTLPILIESSFAENSFTILCGMFALNDVELGNSSYAETYKKWQGDILKLHFEKYGFNNLKDQYTKRKEKFTIKTFETLEVEDCMILQPDIFSSKADNHIFITENECVNITSQIISSQKFIPAEKNLIVDSNEFFYELISICQESVIRLQNNPHVAFATYYQTYDEYENQIKSPLITLPYWSEQSGEVTVKCAFISADKSGGFLWFDNLFKSSVQEQSSSKTLETTFSYCPKDIFYGEGFYLENNFTPFFDPRDNSVVVVAEWQKGQYPITRLVFTTSEGTMVIPGAEGLDLENLSEYNMPNAIWSSYVNLDLNNYPQLQPLQHGAMPLIIKLPRDGNFEGKENIQIRAYDTSGGESWSSCTVNIIKNPKGIDKVVRNYGEQGNLDGNTFRGQDLFSDEFDTDNLKDTWIPRLINLNIHGNIKETFIDFDIELAERRKPDRIFINLGICSIPDKDSSGCIDQITQKGSIYNQHRYTQRVHYLDDGYAVNDFDFELVENTPNSFTARYKNIPLHYVPCEDIDYSYSDEYLSNPLYELNLDCVLKDFSEILLLLDSIDLVMNLNMKSQCNFIYSGYGIENDNSRPTGPSLIFNDSWEDCDQEYWKSENIPITEGRSFGEKRYIKNFDFSEIVKVELYDGAPFTSINP